MGGLTRAQDEHYYSVTIGVQFLAKTDAVDTLTLTEVPALGLDLWFTVVQILAPRSKPFGGRLRKRHTRSLSLYLLHGLVLRTDSTRSMGEEEG